MSQKIRLSNRMSTVPAALTRTSGKIEQRIVANSNEIQDALVSANKKKIFGQFVIIALAAYMSHIAYDVFVDNKAYFPLLVPFNFKDILIHQIYALPLEGLSILLVYFGYRILGRRRMHS